MLEWLKERWYWVVGGILGIWIAVKLFESFGSSASAGANVSSSTPTGTSIVYGGTNANDAAIQTAQIQAQSSLASQQIASGQAVQVAQIAQQATASTNATNLAQVQDQDATAVAITNSNNQLGLVQSNNQTSVQLLQTRLGYQLGVNTNATNLEALQNTNATNLAAYGIQATVVNNQTDAMADVYNTVSDNQTAVQLAALQDATSLQSQQLGNTAKATADTYSLVSSGVLNKGGEGGTNQVAAWNAAVNPTSASSGDAASAAVGVAQSNSNQTAGIISAIGTQTAGIISAIGTSIKGGLSVLAS